MPRLVMFEGIPGSGKSTTSHAIANRFTAVVGACGWALEEDPDHPFFGPDIRRQHRSASFADLCIERWREAARSSVPKPWVLDGCALQSTVRFMFEQARPLHTIEDYWLRFNDAVAPADPRLVYFRHRNVESFLRSHTVVARASVWDKIAAHIATTPRARTLEGHQHDLPIEFWVRYSALCDSLIDQATVPVLNLTVEQGWDSVEDLTSQWLGLIPATGSHESEP